MKPSTCITTSWDDGHPLDLRVAEPLAKYGLQGTFYVPMTAEYETMTAAQLRELSSAFEIGAHTLHHVDLNAARDELARQEITESKTWIEDRIGLSCPMFCPPKGKFSRRHLDCIRAAGYEGVRSVELLSLDFPQRCAGLALMPTTLQAHPHGRLAYVKNALKRGATRNLWRYLMRGCPGDRVQLSRSLLGSALKRGGVFHLWGHSWEVEQNGQWQRLEEVLRFLGDFTSQARVLTNGQLCQVTPAVPMETTR